MDNGTPILSPDTDTYFLRVRSNVSVNNEGVWSLQLWVSECSDNMDPNIFVMQQLPPVAHKDDSTRHSFVDIASVHDMVEYPIDAAEPPLAFYRIKSAEIEMVDSAEFQIAHTNIQSAISRLMNSINKIGL